MITQTQLKRTKVNKELATRCQRKKKANKDKNPPETGILRDKP